MLPWLGRQDANSCAMLLDQRMTKEHGSVTIGWGEGAIILGPEAALPEWLVRV